MERSADAAIADRTGSPGAAACREAAPRLGRARNRISPAATVDVPVCNAADDKLPPERATQPGRPPVGLPSFDRLDLDRLCLALCHDLRAPVATAGAAIASLAGRLSASGNEQLHLVQIAQQSLARADDLLASVPRLIAGPEPVELVAVDLDALVGELCDEIRPELRLIGGTLRVHGRLPQVLADFERLRVALRNLLRNAIRYRRASVPLTIALRAWRRGPERTITVSDNGVGIPRPERGRIFAPLVRGSTITAPGSGLGLTIARHAIESMGGTIAVSSRPRVGTSFAVTLRAGPERPLNAARSDAAASRS